MKVLHLTGEREDAGGVTTVLRGMVTASVSLGWENVVWVNNDYVEKREPALNYRRSRHILGDSANHGRLLFQAWLAFLELRRLVQREHFDVVHAHSRGTLLTGIAMAKWFRRPVVFTNHNYARRVGFYRWASQQTNIFTVLLTPNMARHYGMEVKPPRTTVISACCADHLFNESLAGGARKRDEESIGLRLVGVGSIVRWKHWDLVAGALMQLAETERSRVEFTLWGPTPDDPEARRYAGELRETIKRNRLERQFVLGGPLKSLGEAFRDADWMVHPATNEPCSVAVIEALALGLPVLASASGGMVDIIEPGKSGLLFTPDDSRTLADQIRRILRGRVTVANPAVIRESVHHRSASEVVSEHQKLYAQLAVGA